MKLQDQINLLEKLAKDLKKLDLIDSDRDFKVIIENDNGKCWIPKEIVDVLRPKIIRLLERHIGDQQGALSQLFEDELIDRELKEDPHASDN